MDHEIENFKNWIDKCPLINDHGDIKKSLYNYYIKNTYIHCNDFLLWLRNAPNNLVRNINISEQDRMFVQNATCWYTERVYNNDYRDVAFTEGSYLP